MSGLEVVAAVAAVVSAFHGGSELLQHIQKKRRARKIRNSTQQEWEEQRLQESLVAGGQQIGLRYEQDQLELGDVVRIGDDIARERLYHITLMLQAEIINSLKQAATSQVCEINLRFLHEASISNRKETLVTLDELKQRIYLTRPMARQPRDLGEGSREWQSRVFAPTTKANHESTGQQLSDHYVSSVAGYPPQFDYRTARHASTDYHPLLGRDAPHPVPSAHGPAHAAETNLAMALQGLPPNLPAAMMRDIQHVISSYRDLRIDGGSYPEQSHRYSPGYSGRSEAVDTSYNRNLSDTANIRFEKDAQHYDVHQMPRTYSDQDAAHSSRSPAFRQDIFGLQNEQYGAHSSLASPNPYLQMQTRAPTQHPRWSESSGASSAHSNPVVPDRDPSNPSPASPKNSPYAPAQHSQTSDHGRVSSPLKKSYQHDDDDYCDFPIPCSPYLAPEDRYTPPPIAPLAPARNQPNAPTNVSRKDSTSHPSPTTHSNPNTPIHIPWPGTTQRHSPPTMQYGVPQQHPITIEEEQALRDHYRLPQYTVSVTAGDPASNAHNHGREHTRTPSGLSAITSAAVASLGSLNPRRPTRHHSITPSTASTESTTSIPIGILPGRRMHPITTTTSQPSPTDAMMAGRPNKDNSYWGFCKGAWAVREDLKKGLTVRTQPAGYYSTRQLWGCKSCSFTGDVFKAPHPTKKSKQIDIVDPRIKLSQSGIRYRWIFLAKSHVKKKSTDAAGEDNFGCIFCCFEDKVSGVYGGVEALMNHIALVHVGEMSEQVRRKANCILGVVAGSDEAFDINVPIFGAMDGK